MVPSTPSHAKIYTLSVLPVDYGTLKKQQSYQFLHKLLCCVSGQVDNKLGVYFTSLTKYDDGNPLLSIFLGMQLNIRKFNSNLTMCSYFYFPLTSHIETVKIESRDFHSMLGPGVKKKKLGLKSTRMIFFPHLYLMFRLQKLWPRSHGLLPLIPKIQFLKGTISVIHPLISMR